MVEERRTREIRRLQFIDNIEQEVYMKQLKKKINKGRVNQKIKKSY